MFENCELASHHTPRLNAFLGEVAAAARRAGGSFGVCPSETAGQGYRQWVLSLPRRVRFLLARDSDLLSQTLGVFLAKLFAWQRR